MVYQVMENINNFFEIEDFCLLYSFQTWEAFLRAFLYVYIVMIRDQNAWEKFPLPETNVFENRELFYGDKICFRVFKNYIYQCDNSNRDIRSLEVIAESFQCMNDKENYETLFDTEKLMQQIWTNIWALEDKYQGFQKTVAYHKLYTTINGFEALANKTYHVDRIYQNFDSN